LASERKTQIKVSCRKTLKNGSDNQKNKIKTANHSKMAEQSKPKKRFAQKTTTPTYRRFHKKIQPTFNG